MSRKKRVKKGIESLEKQIELHKEKLDHARKKGNEYLAKYYEKEIEKFEKRIKQRKKVLALKKRKGALFL